MPSLYFCQTMKIMLNLAQFIFGLGFWILVVSIVVTYYKPLCNREQARSNLNEICCDV